jgi:hypothetical protein
MEETQAVLNASIAQEFLLREEKTQIPSQLE